jgi:hypothetical protein
VHKRADAFGARGLDEVPALLALLAVVDTSGSRTSTRTAVPPSASSALAVAPPCRPVAAVTRTNSLETMRFSPRFF